MTSWPRVLGMPISRSGGDFVDRPFDVLLDSALLNTSGLPDLLGCYGPGNGSSGCCFL